MSGGGVPGAKILVAVFASLCGSKGGIEPFVDIGLFSTSCSVISWGISSVVSLFMMLGQQTGCRS